MAFPGIYSLSLANFRNYESVELQPEGASVVLVGPNGAGKTNILEALSFLSPGRGLRRAKLSDVLYTRRTSPAWHVGALIKGDNRLIEVGTSAVIQESKERRTCQVFGKTEKTLSSLAHHLSLSWLTPQMDRLFQEGNTGRRRFLDRLCLALFPHHADLVNQYENFLTERHLALATTPVDPHWLNALETQLFECGFQISTHREQLCLELNQLVATRPSSFPRAAIHLNGKLEHLLATHSLEEARALYRSILQDERRSHAESPHPSLGPHRTQVEFWHIEKNQLAHLCSTGEQKALLLSTILAFGQLMVRFCTGIPVLLLDEAVAHLDFHRRQALYEELLALKIQVWMTGTEKNMFEGFENKAVFYYVENAVITECVTLKQGLFNS